MPRLLVVVLGEIADEVGDAELAALCRRAGALTEDGRVARDELARLVADAEHVIGTAPEMLKGSPLFFAGVIVGVRTRSKPDRKPYTAPVLTSEAGVWCGQCDALAKPSCLGGHS